MAHHNFGYQADVIENLQLEVPIQLHCRTVICRKNAFLIVMP